MTIALAFDCCCAQIAVAVAASGPTGNVRLLACRAEALDRGHAAELLRILRETLQDAGASMSSVGLLAVTTGPGSFTGVRIGLAAARGLALATGKPLAGYSTLQVLAAGVSEAAGTGTVVTALDTKRDGYYLSVDGAAPFIGAAGELVSRLPADDVHLIGDRVEELKSEMLALRCTFRIAATMSLPDAAELVRLALQDGAGIWTDRNRRDGLPRPIYLRGADVTVAGKRVQV